ncbi:MAG: TIGR00289 family protein [Candidatus Bathyarchaeota archaeon]|nr:MAG: TIGR00289 family protein [Candidatus Bathyarchaeota archaeon]
MRVAALISGGKDSALALHRALQEQFEVKFLVAMIPQREDSWMFHYPNIHLVDYFAEATGIPLVKEETAAIKEEELKDLKRALATLDIEGVVSGSIASQYQKQRIEKICKEIGIVSITPLWKENQLKLLRELVRQKFKAIITGVYAQGFDEGWLGKQIGTCTINSLIDLKCKYHISLIGEGGEYETLVLDAPFFKKRIDLVEVEKIWKSHSGWLQVKKAHLIAKR